MANKLPTENKKTSTMATEQGDRTYQQFPKELFEFATDRPNQADLIQGETQTFWKDSWVRLRKNKGALFGIIIITAIILLAIFGPMMNSYDVDGQNLQRTHLPPKVPVLENISFLPFDGVDSRGADRYAERNIDEYFWFGTDELGRDLWTRIWKGTQISLYIAFLATTLDLMIGVVYGSTSGFFGGRIDNIMQRVVEVLVGIPGLIINIMLILILKPGILSITLAMVIAGWISMARIVRGQTLKLKNQEFILASRTLGASNSRLISKHILPNMLGPIIVSTTFTIPGAIFTEALLSFIGLGLQPPTASLGTIINDSFKILRIHPHSMVISSIIISLIMISFNLLGDGLRDAFDPKMRK